MCASNDFGVSAAGKLGRNCHATDYRLLQVCKGLMLSAGSLNFRAVKSFSIWSWLHSGIVTLLDLSTSRP
jgi:hypothetical protein